MGLPHPISLASWLPTNPLRLELADCVTQVNWQRNPIRLDVLGVALKGLRDVVDGETVLRFQIDK